MNLHESKQLGELIERCRKNDRKAQQELFKASYGYAMSICLRYASGPEEAKEILNDGFLKVFTQLDKYTSSRSFAGWLRRIMINTAIDQYRRNEKIRQSVDISHADGAACSEDFLGNMEAEELLQLVQQLSPAYRMVFVLYAVEGFSHAEIAEKLNISEGTSKSNLAKARLKLQKLLQDLQKGRIKNPPNQHERREI